MGIFSFFKKKKKETVKEIEIVNQDKLFEWVKDKKKWYKKNEDEFLLPIKEKMDLFISELEVAIVVLQSVNIENRTDNKRFKHIVKENLKNYIDYMNKVIRELKKINKREGFIESINVIFRDFENKSNINYQKASFLMKNDIQKTKDIIRKFLINIENILKSNKNYFEEFESIGIIDNYIKEIKSIKKNRIEILNDLSVNNEKLKSLEKNLEKKKNQIEDLKNSDKFKEEEKKKEKLEFDKQELNREIDRLRSLVDFKALSHFYHKFYKEMKWVKEYKDNFRYALKNLKLEKLIDLLRESKLDNHEIFESIEKINNKEKDILSISFIDIGINNLLNDIERINFNISETKSKKITKERKIRIFDEHMNEIIEKIKKELFKIHVELKL